jgi:uncharacterized lipoprotein YbaY/heat shock protein HslJ
VTRRFLVLGVLLSMGCGSSPVHVAGTVTYREGIAFPAGAKIHVMLQDVSGLNPSAAIVAEQTVVVDSAQAVVEFALECDPGGVDSDHAYIVRAEVVVDGETRFLSTTEYSVITRGHPTRADVVVESVWRPRIAPPDMSVPGATTVVGTFAYMADAGRFSFCGTGASFPVKQQGDNAALEHAYTGVPHEPGAPVVVTIYGRLEPSLPMEGKLPQDHVIVDRFLQIWPDETCAKVGVETSLSNTYWKLVELNGRAVATREDQREVHMLLHPGDARVNGFAGCNQFNGGYRQTGPNLHFDQLATTLMACPYSDEERAFMQALESVTSYQTLGESLDLRGESGSIARFRAVYLR